MTDCANNNLNPNIGPSGNTSAPGTAGPAGGTTSIDDKIQEFNDRIDAVGDKLDILTASLGSPDDYDDRNIVAGDMDSLIIGGGGTGGQGSGDGCDFDLTIKANNWITNCTSYEIDKCSDPNQILLNSEVTTVSNSQYFVFNSYTSSGNVEFASSLGNVIVKPTTKTSFESGILDITSGVTTVNIGTPTLNITTAGDSVTIDGTTWASILTRLASAESAISTLQTDVSTAQSTADGAATTASGAQSTADNKVSISTFNNHTHTFSDDATASGTTGEAGDGNTLPTHTHGFSDSFTVSDTTSTP